MKINAGNALGALLPIITFAIPAACADEWDEADRQVRRLDPAVFIELPKKVVDDLKASNCRIPQAYHDSSRHNVIKGSFANPDQTDWAVLCSQDGASSIRIYWGGPTKCDSRIQVEEDTSGLQGIGDGKIGYSRVIAPVSEVTIRKYHEASAESLSVPVTHHGIDDVFVGKGSVVYYCADGRWIELTGAD